MSFFVENATIVLVHGAWADGSCWQHVIMPLRREGLRYYVRQSPWRRSPRTCPLSGMQLREPKDRLYLWVMLTRAQ
jgi:hypothetical protein